MTTQAIKQAAVPAHVPAELVGDFDFKKNIDSSLDSYVEFKKLHSGPDVFWTTAQEGHWVVTRFEDIETIFKNEKGHFSSENALIPKGARPLKILPLESDPPLTQDYRKIIMPYFTPAAIDALQTKIKEITVSLIDGMVEQGECEFVSAYAQKMPISIFMHLVNLPEEDVPMLLEYAGGFFHGETPEAQMQGTQQMVGYVMQKLMERRENLGDDILSAVLKGTVEGGRNLTEQEIIGMSTVLLLGGLDTVAATFGWVAKFLADNPGNRQQLIDDPKLINRALEEIMRRYSIGCLAREVKEDVEFKEGIIFKKGEMVLLPTVLAGIDERQFDDPFTVDFARKNTKSLMFGAGPHMCIGSMLARYEIRNFIAVWLERIPEFQVKPGSETGYINGITHALKELHLEWEVK